jgi:hypothetical protein
LSFLGVAEARGDFDTVLGPPPIDLFLPRLLPRPKDVVGIDSINKVPALSTFAFEIVAFPLPFLNEDADDPASISMSICIFDTSFSSDSSSIAVTLLFFKVDFDIDFDARRFPPPGATIDDVG